MNPHDLPRSTDGILRVAVPAAIGDCHFVCQKLKALRALHGNAPLKVYCNQGTYHQARGFLSVVQTIMRASVHISAPLKIPAELFPSHADDFWASLRNSRGWKWFDYMLAPMGWLTSRPNRRIEDWLPELDTEYSLSYCFNKKTIQRTMSIMREPNVIIHLSSIVQNLRQHGGWWLPQDWVRVIEMLNEAGIEPLLVGMDSMGHHLYHEFVAHHANGVQYQSAIGKTTVPDVCLLAQRCKGWIGTISGLEVIAASMGKPVVSMWNNAEHFHLVGNARLPWSLQTCWLGPQHTETYRSFSFGSMVLTPHRVVRELLGMIRDHK